MRLLLACRHHFFGVAVFGVSALSGFGAPQTNEATATRVTVRGTELKEFDWAKLQARARVAYVSSGPRTLSGRMIDNDLQTVFRFSESDKSPTVIVELAQTAKLHRVSAAFTAEDARVDVFLLSELPKDVADLRFAKPDASIVELPDEHGMVKVDFQVSSARYVAFRWNRNRWREPFAVAEISAFSNDPSDSTAGDDVRLADTLKTFAAVVPPQVPVISE